MAQDVEPFRIGRHHSVLDAVVDHLHEVPRAVGAAMQEALLRGGDGAAAAGRAPGRAGAGRERFEDRLQVLDDGGFAADHQAVAPIDAGDAAAGADVDVMVFRRREAFGAADVVAVVGVAAVDDDVAGRDAGQQFPQQVIHRAGGHHQPDGARPRHPGHQFGDRRRADGIAAARGDDVRHHGRLSRVDHARMSLSREAPDHVGPHATEADHSELHCDSPVGV